MLGLGLGTVSSPLPFYMLLCQQHHYFHRFTKHAVKTTLYIIGAAAGVLH
jgi:hypothetical protein